MDAKIIKNDLDLMQSVNTRVVNIEPGYDFPYEYLSKGWFKMIGTAVKEAKARGMKVWLIDDAKYPSGFAGGKFSRERPDLKMWALVQLDEKLVKNDGADPEQIADIIKVEVNSKVPGYSKLFKVEILSEPFQKTPKLTIKRFLYG